MKVALVSVAKAMTDLMKTESADDNTLQLVFTSNTVSEASQSLNVVISE